MPEPEKQARQGSSLNRKWKGVPLWGWYLGGGVAVGSAFILVHRYRAAKVQNLSAGQALADLGGLTDYMSQSPLPGYGGIGGGSGLPIFDVPPVQQPTNTETPSPGTQALPQPQPSAALPAPVVSTGATNRYTIGQVVNPTLGEHIVSSVLSPVYGWLNLTNLGGIFTGGGGTRDIGSLPYGGSYLGYVQQQYGTGTPASATERSLHGDFSTGAIELTPGGYRIRNVGGETYSFEEPAPQAVSSPIPTASVSQPAAPPPPQGFTGGIPITRTFQSPFGGTVTLRR